MSLSRSRSSTYGCAALRSTSIPAGCRGWDAWCNSAISITMTVSVESARAASVRLRDVALAAIAEMCGAGRERSTGQEDEFLHNVAATVRGNGRLLHRAMDECARRPPPDDEPLVWLAGELHLSRMELLAVAVAAAVEDNPLV